MNVLLIDLKLDWGANKKMNFELEKIATIIYTCFVLWAA